MDQSKVIETATIETVNDVIRYTVVVIDNEYRDVAVYRTQQSDDFKVKELGKDTLPTTDDSDQNYVARNITEDLKANAGAVVSVSYNKGEGFETWATGEDGFYLMFWQWLPLYVKGWLMDGNHPANSWKLVDEAWGKELEREGK